MKKIWCLLLTLFFAVGIISPMAIIEVYAADGIVMTVNDTEYTDHATGWSAAVKLAESGTDVAVKLFANWEADAATGFVCSEGGTKDGALYVGESKGKFLLDLNGYTLDRNAPQDKYYSSVLYVEYCNFTLDDTSEAKTGTITGGLALKGGGIYTGDCTLTINGGNITGNKAKEGGGVYTYDTNSYMNGGSITDNEAVDGGGVYANYYDFTMNDGIIARNISTADGGGVMISGTFLRVNTRFLMNGGLVEENYAHGNGGAVYLDYDTDFEMKGGILRNNTAFRNGGAVFTYFYSDDNNKEDSSVHIEGGSIIGNVAQTGNGGGICWDQGASLYLSNCTITGNSAPKGYGGGVYMDENSFYLVVGGTLNITGNTALTDRSDNVSNVSTDSDSDLDILREGELNADSKIGLSSASISNSILTQGSWGNEAEFTLEMANCFFSDDPRYIVVKEQNGDYYDLYIDENPNPSISGSPLFTVEVNGEGRKDFYDRREGWAYVLERSETTDVKLKLHGDWVAGNGYFSYYESGTYEGALYIPDSCTHNITIDLNGYSIDRNLKYSADYGRVIYMDTYGSLTIIDSSEEKTGKITGGNTDAINAYISGDGGGIYVDYGTLYLKGVTVTGNFAEYGAGIYCSDQDDAIVYIQDGTKIYGNAASVSGGGIYMENGYLYLEDGEIRDNDAANGAGIYWDSDNDAYLTGGKITGNVASDKGDGVYVSNRGYIYLGGDIQITDNDTENLYLSGGYSNVSNACGQDGAPNKPLTTGAKIGISSGELEEEISADNSRFYQDDFKFFYSDNDSYYIRTVYDADDEGHVHKLYINTKGHADGRNPCIRGTKIKDTNLLRYVYTLGSEIQDINLTAHNTRRDFFQKVALSDLIECTFDEDTTYIADMDVMVDLREGREYKIVSDNGTYVLCKVTLIPDGGEWSPDQEVQTDPFRMTVTVGKRTLGYYDFGEAWEFAVSQSEPVTVTLFKDWIAPNGRFDYSKGTDNGRLYLDDNKDITIDLNGNTISRGLTSATENGQVFLIEDGAKLTINDSAQVDSGKITGGYNDGNGGAFYVDYGELHINGGEIVGNTATGDGGAIYGTNEDDTFIYINGGKLTGNTAFEDGGAIFMYNGYLYVDGGEISYNNATNGGGIYWESRDKLCLTGGVIKRNNAKEGVGVYATDWGDMYIGGTLMIRDNYKTENGIISKNNLYLSDTDAYLNNAAGQSEVPNKPLTEGADVGITANGENFCMSDSDSRFTLNSANYLTTDLTSHIIRSVYNADGGNNSYKIYYNKYYDVTIPRVSSVEGIHPNINYIYFNNDLQYIRLKFDMKHRDDGTLNNIALSELVSASLKNTSTEIVGFNEKRDFTTNQEFMVSSSDGTYIVLSVYVEFVCVQHEDADGDCICDYCRKNMYVDFTIANYNAETQEATVFVTKPGRYSLIFADYEDGKLGNIDIVEYDFEAGANTVSQGVANFTLASGDKVMLWYDMTGFVPVCEALIIN